MCLYVYGNMVFRESTRATNVWKTKKRFGMWHDVMVNLDIPKWRIHPEGYLGTASRCLVLALLMSHGDESWCLAHPSTEESDIIANNGEKKLTETTTRAKNMWCVVFGDVLLMTAWCDFYSLHLWSFRITTVFARCAFQLQVDFRELSFLQLSCPSLQFLQFLILFKVVNTFW